MAGVSSDCLLPLEEPSLGVRKGDGYRRSSQVRSLRRGGTEWKMADTGTRGIEGIESTIEE